MHFGSLRTNPFSTVCHYLENFIFDEVPQFLIVQIAHLKAKFLYIERLWHRRFPVNFTKFLRTPLVATSESEERNMQIVFL